eukprot:1736213-Pyramimonas_sp.AAC.1
MARHPAVAIMFHSGRRHGIEEILKGRIELPAPRRPLPLGRMAEVEVQEEMQSNGLECQGMGCQEMRAMLNEQRIENGQGRRGVRVADPELRGLAKKRKAELILLVKKHNIKVNESTINDNTACLLLGQIPKAAERREIKGEAPLFATPNDVSATRGA